MATSFRHAFLNDIDRKEDPAIFSRPRNSEGRKNRERNERNFVFQTIFSQLHDTFPTFFSDRSIREKILFHWILLD